MKIRVQSADMDTVVEVDVLKLAFQAAYEQTQPLKLGLIVEFNSADLSDTFYMSTEALLDEMGVQYKSKGALGHASH